jgi:hypothetical protein
MHSYVIGMKACHVVHANAIAPAPARSLYDDVDAPRRAPPDVPMSGRREMTEHRSWPARQHGGHPMTEPGDAPVPDRVDAAVQDMQVPFCDASPHRASTETKLLQLVS